MKRIHSEEIQAFEREHIAAVRDFSPECMVLLKNMGVLPLKRPGKIALYGNGARNTVKGGTGSGDVNVRHFVNVEEGLENAGFEIVTKDWLDAYDEILDRTKRDFALALKAEADASGMPFFLFFMGKVVPEPDYDIPLGEEGEAAVYVLARNSGEGSDRKDIPGDIRLTDTEIRDILRLNEVYEKFVLVLNVGGMVDLTPVENVKAILLLSQLGVSTGDALANVLLGKASPSGKLTMSWAPIKEYPSTEGFGNPDDTLYKEGIYVGYRYFDTMGKKAMYPFGFGLGYTTFSMEAVSLEKNGGMVKVRLSVRNTGTFNGKEVVQVYYSAPEGRIEKPYQELAAYVKTKELIPGESQELTISFDMTSMASFDKERGCYVLEKGQYYIKVGNSSRNTQVAGVIDLLEEVVTQKANKMCQGSVLEGMGPEKSTLPCEEETDGSEGTPILWEEVKKGNKTTEEFVASLNDEQLAYLCTGAYQNAGKSSGTGVIGNSGMYVAGAAGETTHGLADLGMEALIMADGPAGLRLSTRYTLGEDGMAHSLVMPFSNELLEYLEIPALRSWKEAMKKQEKDAGNEIYYQYATAIPIGTALAQSWNEELCRNCGNMVGREMELFGVNLWLAPGLNIQRSPLCGRNFEYYSEDPLISGNTAAAITIGVQGHAGCGVTIKHFACNNQETNRFFSNSVIDERALREIYLKGFEICVKRAMPHAVMTSYNLLNGEHACSNRFLLTQILREEWGFQGIVMSDWRVTDKERRNTGKYACASAAGCVKAGNDIVMPGSEEDKEDILFALRDAAHPYALTRNELLSCAKRVCDMVAILLNS